MDRRLYGYDDRIGNKYVFQSPLALYDIHGFSGFDNYIITGLNQGMLAMYDKRMNDYIMTRYFEPGYINQVTIQIEKLSLEVLVNQFIIVI